MLLIKGGVTWSNSKGKIAVVSCARTFHLVNPYLILLTINRKPIILLRNGPGRTLIALLTKMPTTAFLVK